MPQPAHPFHYAVTPPDFNPPPPQPIGCDWIICYPSRHPKQNTLYVSVPCGHGYTTDPLKAHRFPSQRLATAAADVLHSPVASYTFDQALESGLVSIERLDQPTLPLEVKDLTSNLPEKSPIVLEGL